MALKFKLRDYIHFDYFNQQYPKKQVLAERICLFCHVQFSSKAAVLRHRRFMHYRKRYKGDPIDYNLDSEIEKLQSERVKSITKIGHKRGSEYLCLFDDGSSNWLHLPSDNYHVMQYTDFISSNKPILPTIEDPADWLDFYGNLSVSINSSSSDDDDIDLYHVDKGNKEKVKQLKQRKSRKRSRKECLKDDYQDEMNRFSKTKGLKSNSNNKYVSSDSDSDLNVAAIQDNRNSSDDDAPIIPPKRARAGRTRAKK